METLIPFLKHSNYVDWFFIILVIVTVVILTPVGIWIVIASRRRKPIFFFLAIALLPLLIALLGGYLRFRFADNLLGKYPGLSARTVAEIRQRIRQEMWITTYIGAAGTAVPGLIGVTGLVLKKDRKD